jgi:hypothetical protein
MRYHLNHFGMPVPLLRLLLMLLLSCRGRPSELLMKQLALIGSAALMLAHSIR